MLMMLFGARAKQNAGKTWHFFHYDNYRLNQSDQKMEISITLSHFQLEYKLNDI